MAGHARLKAALVLRDALAHELGLTLAVAIDGLRRVEYNVSAAQAMADGNYLDALKSACAGDKAQLAELDERVRFACSRAQFAPRYPQYLALLLFAYWVQARQEDGDALLARLNAWLAAHPPAEPVAAFVEADLQLAAFWMATAAGKTHVLHACLALLEKQSWDRLIVITPSESLTRQHADKLRALAAWDVFAYPMDGDAAVMGHKLPGTVIVLDINKLATDKKGEGVTVSTSVFKDGRNLVFVDEGHKGQKSEASVWKDIQSTLAGIGPEHSPRHRGLLIEFSATFGQVVESENSFERYAKAIVFDYAYDRFHRDRYGKDFWHVRVQAGADVDDAAEQETLTAALLAYWHQVASFRSHEARTAWAAQGLQVAAPLWVLLGLSVIGSTKNEGDKAQTSDVVKVLRYLTGLLARPDRLREDLQTLLGMTTAGADILPSAVRMAVRDSDAQTLADTVLADCFGWRAGDKPVLRLVKAATGELGLGLLRGDTTHYWGVVNVGDAGGLKKALEVAGMSVDDDAMSASLFARLDAPDSGLNVLIGSRRFAEGWDNYRASSLTLLRLGQSEGSLIIQMFGRVVRFAGVSGNGKRLERPGDLLAPLQTAYVYGLKSGYLNTFLQGLMDNGVHETRRVECEVKHFAPSYLQAVRSDTPLPRSFQVEAFGGKWLSRISEVSFSMQASVSTSALKAQGVVSQRGFAGEDITADFKRLLPLVDEDAIYRDLLAWRTGKRHWNFAYNRAAIHAALNDGPYVITGLPGALKINRDEDLARLNRIAGMLVRRMFEGLYRRQSSQKSRYRMSAVVNHPDKYQREERNAE